MGVDKERLPIKLHFFFWLGGLAPVMPFISLVMKELGFSATVAGTIFTVIPVIAMFAKPLIGAIADRYQIHRSILVGLLSINVVLIMLFRLVPPLPVNSSVRINCTSDERLLMISTSKANDQCFMNSISSTTNVSNVICKFSLKDPNGKLNSTPRKQTIEDATLLPEVLSMKLIHPFKMDSTTIGIHVKSPNSSILEQNSVPDCESTEYLVGHLHCDNPQLHEIITKPVVKDTEVISYHQFWILLFIVLTMRIVASCAENLSDSICFKMLGGDFYDYGLQRMWGSAGWGITSILAGILVDKMSEGKATKDRSIAFYLSAIVSAMDVLVCFKLKAEEVQAKKNQQIWSRVRTAIKDNPKFLIFLVLVVACGIFTSFLWNFLFWLIEDIVKEDGCTDFTKVQTLNGLVLSVNCYLGEIPFFFLSGWILKKVSYEHCMTLVLATFGVRFIAYYFVINPWWILPIEILNGVTLGLFYSTMTTYANALTPPGLQGTMQGIASAAFEGFGFSIGSLIGGYLFDYVGGRKLFLLGGVFALFLAVFHASLLMSMGKPNNDEMTFESNVDDKKNSAQVSQKMEEKYIKQEEPAGVT